VDKNYLYRAQKLTKELNEVYAGDLAKMETKYGFNPVFVQWRQEHKTGGFEQMQLDRMQRAATAKAARLEQLAFQINYPLPSQVPHAPAWPNNRLMHLILDPLLQPHVCHPAVLMAFNCAGTRLHIPRQSWNHSNIPPQAGFAERQGLAHERENALPSGDGQVQDGRARGELYAQN
jgi:hypothetical protein